MRSIERELPAAAEVVVIGGGVMGASIAHHLAQAGTTDVLVLERDRVGSGSSGKPRGGLRAQFSDPLNIALGARSLQAYRGFAERFGTDIGMESVGYLFLLRNADDLARFEASVAVQNDEGVPSRIVSEAEARRLCPYLAADTFVGAAFSPDDGHARPAAVIAAYLDAARSRGVQVREQCAVLDVEVAGGEIAAVVTDRGRVRASTVICAAGAWSQAVGAMAGVELDVHPLRRQIAFTPALTPAPPRIPFTIDYSSTMYFHNAGDALLLGWSDPGQAPGFETAYSDDWLPQLRAAAAACAPQLADVPLTHGWAGLYEMTPDRNALVGEAPGVARFLYATGFSGHGFLQAPAVGEVVSDLYHRRAPSIDVSPLRAERFAGDAPIVEVNIV